jgi:hypothetical protein
MSAVKTNAVILGQSATENHNFLLDTDAAGALRIRRRSDGSGGTLLNIPVGGTTRQLAQIQTFQTGAVDTTATVFAGGDAIPQITEGKEFMNLVFTPMNAGSTLEIDVSCLLSDAVAGAIRLVAALFRDSVTNALAANIAQADDSGGTLVPIQIKHVMTSGTTSPITFRVRGGPVGVTTVTFNGIAGTRLLGGVMASRITIKEYLP